MNNDRGFTLVELLAVLALMSVIIVLISSVHIFGQKQYINQSDQINHQSDTRYIINQIAKEVRNAKTLSVSENVLKIDAVEYKHSGTQVTKNGIVIAKKIEVFSTVLLPESKGKGLMLEVKSSENKQGHSTTLKTVVYVRE